MRFWLSESERRPDPKPARTDARKAVVAGTAGWLLALVLCLGFRERLAETGYEWFLTASALGVALGVIGFVVVQWRRSRPDQRSGSPTS